MGRYRYTLHDLLNAQAAAKSTKHHLDKVLDKYESGWDAESIYEYLSSYAASAAYPCIVQSGFTEELHSSMLKLDTSTRRPVLIDFGLTYGGMCADYTVMLTRCLSYDAERIWSAVSCLQQEIAEYAKAGVFWGELDIIFVEFQQTFRSDLKHKIGHWVHEDVHAKNLGLNRETDCLQEGDIITLEPGVYRKDLDFMCRIEDCYVVTKTGARKII